MSNEAESISSEKSSADTTAGKSSVILKITASVIMVVVLALTAITVLGERTQRSVAEHTHSAFAVAVTKLIAAGQAGSIRFKKANVIEKAYADLVADKGEWVDGFFALDRKGNEILMHQSERVGDVKLVDTVREALKTIGEEPVIVTVENSSVIVAPSGKSKKDGKPYGYLAIGWNTGFIDQAISGGRTKNAIAGVIGVIGIVGLLFFVTQWQVTGPLKRITASIQSLAEGNRNLDIPETGRSDEIGQIANALSVLRSNEFERHRLAGEEKETIARREERQARTESLISNFKTEVQTLLETVVTDMGHMEETARDLTNLSDGTAEKATTAASATEQASANVNSVASSAEELSASISEISRQLAAATEVVAKGSDNADRSNERIGGLTEAASKIGEVVNLIQDISEQTHLLALNATIEAARAGEMGKGFAVVASEVKTLASQTAGATGEIAEHIAAIQASTDEAVESIEAIGGSISEISKFTNNIATSMQEQGSATAEISRSSQEAAVGTKEMASSMASVNDAVANTRASANEVITVSNSVSNQAAKLRSVINEFLDEVAAA